MKVISQSIATFFGLGYFPLAPGTLASLAPIAIWFFFKPQPAALGKEIIILFFLIASGVWASRRFSRSVDKNDPRQVVIDEVCGQLVVLVGLPSSQVNLFLAFLLFRALDIIKPFPIGYAEKLPGGWGIMADDLAAGILARALLGLILWIF